MQGIKKYAFNRLENIREPFPLWREMLDDGPVVRSKMMLVQDVWMATHWDAASEVLKDQSRFGRDPRRVGKTQLPGMKWWMPKRFARLAKNMMAFDNEEHRRLRSLVDQAFLRSAVDAMRPRIESIANSLLEDYRDKLASSPACQCDLVANFCRPFPLQVICEVLGLPAEDRPKFQQWFRAFAEVSSGWHLLRAVPGVSKLLKYLDERFALERKCPTHGLLSELVQIELEGQRLTHDELVSTVFILLVAGHETTVHLISNAVLQLLRSPEQLTQLRQDASLIPGAVEEALRYTGVVQFSKPRFVIEDCEFHGVSLKRGEYIMSALAAANVDPRKFENPETFDIRRNPNPHLAFGTGAHICLGLKLAKAETEIALQQIFERLPDLRLLGPQVSTRSAADATKADAVEATRDADPEGVVWTKRMGLRSLKHLTLTGSR